MQKNAPPDAKQVRDQTITLCLTMIAMALAWAVMAVAVHKGFLPLPPANVLDWTRAALG